MSKVFTIFFILIFVHVASAQNEIYVTRPLTDNIKSLQVLSPDNSQLLPVISLNSNNKLVVKFDNLDISQPRLRYRLIHCNADWTKSELTEIDFLSGFNDNMIDNYKFSNNTLVNYIHYDLELPNRDINFKVSGNYALFVYDEYSPQINILMACFSVLEPNVKIDASVTGNTDIDFNKKHQQLKIEVDHKNIPIQDPDEDIKLLVRQNTRLDNIVDNVKPSYSNSDKLIYDHNKSLIFEAGNEYRRFEIVNKQYGGLNVEKVNNNNSSINALLTTDNLRSNSARFYDKDQNGQYFIKNNDAFDNDTESDYFLVHFTLNAPFKDVILEGELSYGSSDIILKTDNDSGLLKTSVLLKQGAYNYQYLSSSNNNEELTAEFTEGNYYETENIYSIFVYHRPPGIRYDKLVGFSQVSSTQIKQ